jgi:hypothetical protein
VSVGPTVDTMRPVRPDRIEHRWSWYRREGHRQGTLRAPT